MAVRDKLSGAVLGYALVMKPEGDDYGVAAAEVVLDALYSLSFTGTCEYYAADNVAIGTYIVGLGLQSAHGRVLPSWWNTFIMSVTALCEECGTLSLDRNLSEFERVGLLRSSLLHRGGVLFHQGVPSRVLAEADSWYVSGARARMDRELG